MILANAPAGATLFVDANVLLFAMTRHPVHGPVCEKFFDRVENQELIAVTSTDAVGDVLHRVMAIEAADRFGWPWQGIANRLRRHPNEVMTLVRPRRVMDEINASRLMIVPVAAAIVSASVDVSMQTGLLQGDALIVALMRDQGLTQLASLDADFDRVPGLTRYSPA